jgi:8-oxo-dGTP pyrophosphatase MutT (NUDIX family)
VLAVVERKSVVLVRAKRPILDDEPLELPAGAAEKDEGPAAAAARELEEETGIVVTDLRRFKPMPPVAINSGRVPTLSYVFRVDLSAAEARRREPHDAEVAAVEVVPIARLPRMMATGRIYVSLTLGILGMVVAQWRKGT